MGLRRIERVLGVKSLKAETNAKWTSTSNYRSNYDLIFKGKDMQRAIDVFEDGFRKFQSEVQRNPKFAFCSHAVLERLKDGFMVKPNHDGSVDVYGVKVRSMEGHNDNEWFTFG